MSRVDDFIKVDIDVSKIFDIAPFTKWNEIAIEDTLKDKGVKLPFFKVTNKSRFYVLMSDYTIKIEYDGYEHAWWLRAGYVWDLASTPAIMKAILDNDAPETLIPSAIHDACPVTEGMEFKLANKLYYWTARWFELSIPKGILSWLGIASIIGRIRWKKNKVRRQYMKDYFTYTKTKVEV